MSGQIVDIISHSVAPDEFRHIGNVLFYAQRDISLGPWIADASPETLRLGEITRFPSYFYYYFSSFFVRWWHFDPTLNFWAVITLRVITLLLGLATLIVVRKLLIQLRFSAVASNLTVLGFSLIGRFVWQSAAVSYDVPSMLLFFLFLLYAVRFLQERNWWLLVPAGTLLLINAIVKYTFLPFTFLYLVMILAWVIFTREPRVFEKPNTFYPWLIALVASIVLFSERILQNVIRFGQVEPRCDKVQTFEACYSAFNIFKRNFNAADAVASGDAPHIVSPFAFIARWVRIIYQSTFFYRGRTADSWHIATNVLVVGEIVIFLTVIVFAIYSMRFVKVFDRNLIILVVLTYLLGVFAFNLKTYLTLHVTFAVSGRYLLPIAPLIMAFVVEFALKAFRNRTGKPWAWAIWIPVFVLLIWFFVWHNPIIGATRLMAI